MIKLNTAESTVFVAAGNVARIDQAGASSQWHGIRSFVRLFDGGVIECHQDATEVARLVEAEEAKEKSHGQ